MFPDALLRIVGSGAHAPARNDGALKTAGLSLSSAGDGARFASVLLPTSSCPCLCARRNGRRAWPFARPPARPAWRPLLPSRARSWTASAAAASASRRFCLGLGGFLGLSRLGTGGGLRFALGLTALHLGIVRSRLGAKLVQNILSRLHRGLLAVGEVRFLESTHKRGLVVFTIGGWAHAGADCALLSEPAAKCQRRNGAARAGETCVYSKWPKLMTMSGITSVWLLYETATPSPEPGAGDPAIWPSRLRADWPGRLAGDARFGEVTHDPGSLSA